MAKIINRRMARRKRQLRAARRIRGTDSVPRMCVTRSLNHMYVQLIDDLSGKTLLAVSTLSKDLKDKIKKTGNIAAAKIIGKEVAERAKNSKITRVVFDKAGYKYHGRVKAVAEAAREGGLAI